MIENTKYENGLAHRQVSGVRVRDGLTFLLVGGGIGAVLALLFAPKSGSELRGEIADVTRKGYDATLEKAGELRVQSAGALQSVKKKAEEVYDFAATKLNSGSDAITDAVATTSAAVRDGLENTRKDTSGGAEHSSSGRTPASSF